MPVCHMVSGSDMYGHFEWKIFISFSTGDNSNNSENKDQSEQKCSCGTMMDFSRSFLQKRMTELWSRADAPKQVKICGRQIAEIAIFGNTHTRGVWLWYFFICVFLVWFAKTNPAFNQILLKSEIHQLIVQPLRPIVQLSCEHTHQNGSTDMTTRDHSGAKQIWTCLLWPEKGNKLQK